MTGFFIIDVTDPSNPIKIASYDNNKGYTYGVTISDDETKAYVANGTSGTWILDISDPNSISTLGLDATDNSGAVALSDDGTKLYVAAGGDGMQIIDVTDPENPERIG